MTTESARLVGLLAELADFFEPNDLSASSIIRQAAALIRSQAEELERLREFVRYIEETSDDEHEVRKARAALGER